MSEGGGRQLAIFGGVAVFAVLLSLMLGLGFEPKCAADALAPEEAKQHDERWSDYEGRVTCNDDCWVTFGPTGQHQTGEDQTGSAGASAEPRQDAALPPVAERDLCAQDRVAWWTRIIAAWTATGAVLLFFALLLTMREIEETRKIGQAQTRAYLSVIRGRAKFDLTDMSKISISILVRNSGSSPAREIILTGTAVIESSDRPLARSPLPELPIYEIGGQELRKKKANDIGFQDSDAINRLRSPGAELGFFGSITYEDVFEKPLEVAFALSAKMKQIGDPPTAFKGKLRSCHPDRWAKKA